MVLDRRRRTVTGKSVKAYGTSVRVKNIDRFVGFEEYDAVSGVVVNPVKTTIPYDHKNYISAITETDESITKGQKIEFHADCRRN